MAELTLESLSIGRGDKALYRDISLAASASQFWGILGENGAGKTTLLHTIARLLGRQSGRILLNGVEVRKLPRKMLARKMGVLLQAADSGFPFTIYESVMAGRYAYISPWGKPSEYDESLVSQALTAVGLAHRQTERADILSGGEQRRVAIATVLAQSPDVYLLDEPANHLDLKFQVKILQHFSSLVKEHKRLAMMTVHDINLAARFCTHLVMLFPEGRWLAGPTAKLLNSDNLSQLYSHPVHSLVDGGRTLWYPG
ncbi:MAG: ABC transporter ATP-binding protein [Hahellaceae bacterium]|nr:ABC transporter ATP-binding protein [Hahellaceae bacterium]MCP5209645.1 ABC transporter ATP-binding protein [Hahellaceae bacterium]